MGKRQLKIADAVTPRKKQAASSYRLSQLEGTGSPASQIQVPADKLRIEVRKYIDIGSVYNADIYAAKPLFQYILYAGKTGETKKYLFRLKEYMSLFLRGEAEERRHDPSKLERLRTGLWNDLQFCAQEPR